MNVKKIKYGKPSEYEKKYKGLPVKLFKDGWDNIKLPNPPSNNSSQVKKEFEEIKNLIHANTKTDKKEIKEQDKEETPFEFQFLKIINQDDKELQKKIDKITDELFTICIFYKRKYNRPRPYQLAKHLKIDLPEIKTETGHSPSYPSGHALSAKFLALYLGDRFPKYKNKLHKFANEIAENRVKGGIHFRSDIEAGKNLAEQLYKLFIDKENKEKKTFKEWFIENDNFI